jgi:F0F1-type ATP synthase membrane subunit b/b'
MTGSPNELAERIQGILAEAEASAERIRGDARREARRMLDEGRRRAEAELEHARRQALELRRDTKAEADRMLRHAHEQSLRSREQTRRAIAGRVETAEAAADEVLADALALSEGLRRLGSLLAEQGEEILREIKRSRRQMRERLEVPVPEAPPRPTVDGPEPPDWVVSEG